MSVARQSLTRALRHSSIATLAGLVVHYAFYYTARTPLLTDRIAEWIMAYTPSRYAVPILNNLGAWAKPWASTGALALLGFLVLLALLAGRAIGPMHRIWLTCASALALNALLINAVGYASIPGSLSFWAPALAAALVIDQPQSQSAGRRTFLVQAARYGSPLVMGAGTVAVAVESYFRNQALAKSAITPVDLFPFQPALDRQRFSNGLARKAVTPVPEFYGMSKNTVDPNVDPRQWKLRITFEGRHVRTWTYPELLALPRQRRYQTLRCISNTLHSDLMGTAEWAGVRLSQLVDRRVLPNEAVEAAFIGIEGHDDSLSIDYAFGEETLLALGMNGKTLSRTHGFPLRLLAPRYYGCRNVKWIGEIRFVTRPYYGTWQRMGYTRNPVVHTASHIDRQVRSGANVSCGGVSFAGDRGIRAVRLRVNADAWIAATLESPLSPFTWTRWCAELPAKPSDVLEANAQDGNGEWQLFQESGPFPNGLSGPTIVKVSV